MFYQSISGVLVILGLIAVGYVLALRGWFSAETSQFLSRLVTQLALPCYMVVTIVERFSARDLLDMLPNLRFPVLSMVILLALAMALAQVFAVDPSHRGLFVSMFFNSNTVFVGLPVNQALFGDQSIPYVLVYYMCNTTFFWTLGIYLIQRDGQGQAGLKLSDSLKKIFSPPLLGFLLGLLLVLLGLELPKVLLTDLTYLGNLTIPLSMLFIGIAIARAGMRNLRLGKDHILILLGRFVMAPLVMAAILALVDAPALMKQVFIVQSAMPVMTNAPVVAKLYGADSQYAAIMVAETTLGMLVVVPLLMGLIG
ncbi:AEC family transporter [Streptococcus sp. DD12]|uniref:AEC family transporter n=1 Tax=Streptococcus sp. DD12 TaxID=1777880 RepID=UPI0007956570|nr:AEC family transporter [Streptococcus sp. DD12]KXT75917.1 Malate permease [Streptococcus sp. DD12]